MSPKKLSTIKSGTITLGQWYRVLQLPLEIQPAVFALIDHGIDGEKLLKLVAPPKRGRPSGKLKRDKRPPGRPSIWTLQIYALMLAFVAEGRQLLQEQGATRITDKAAIKATVAQSCTRRLIRRDEVKGLENEVIKRLPDAKKAIQKLNDKSP